ncbi:MAG: cytochrome c, partial [Gammaproteobacteria bacterium]|nr:cytochrome c [Gammaproteobacteria bacterium]
MKQLNSLLVGAIALLAASLSTTAAAQNVTFHKDIEPILQRSCQNCHREGGVAPMPLVSYQQVAPFAGLIEYKTGIRDRAGAMPPWYAEKDIGIQQYKNDPSLTDQEIQAISQWARTGAPQGDSADAPAPLVFDDSVKWTLGEPDLVIDTEDFFMEAGRPDWWGEIPRVASGLTEDRYVKSVEIVEVNDVPRAGNGRDTVGGRFIFHHMIWRTEVHDEDGNA